MISLSEPIAAALLKSAQVKSVDYIQKNPHVDNFSELLFRSELVDVQKQSRFWQDELFERGRGYTDVKSYNLKGTEKWSKGLSILELRTELGFKFNVDMATTRELLCFYLTNKKMVDRMLSVGEEVVALGKDCFTLAGDVAPVIKLNERNRKILDFVDLRQTLWYPNHLFLVRSNRS
jgi:hypothetical protein